MDMKKDMYETALSEKQVKNSISGMTPILKLCVHRHNVRHIHQNTNGLSLPAESQSDFSPSVFLSFLS